MFLLLFSLLLLQQCRFVFILITGWIFSFSHNNFYQNETRTKIFFCFRWIHTGHGQLIPIPYFTIDWYVHIRYGRYKFGSVVVAVAVAVATTTKHPCTFWTSSHQWIKKQDKQKLNHFSNVNLFSDRFTIIYVWLIECGRWLNILYVLYTKYNTCEF